MALVGVGLTGLLAAVAGAVLLARLLRDTAHPAGGAYSGAFFAVADVVSGRTTFALGAAVALAALVALAGPPRRLPPVGLAVALAVLTGLFSPVAAAFLGLAAAVLVLRRLPGGWPLGVAAAVPVAVLGYLFPSGGWQPYEVGSAPYAVVAGLLLALLTHSQALRLGGLIYALAAAFLLLSPDPFGSNILRLGLLLAAPLVIATATVHWRLVAPVVLGLVWWQAQPPYADLRAQRPPPFAALTSALTAQHLHRVEVVPLRDHGEAAAVAPVLPLARGWSRQIDTARNPLFYAGPLAATTFRQWLVDNAVDAVALNPAARPDKGGRAERALLLIGKVPDLQRVWSGDGWVLWRFTAAAPIASNPVQVLATARASIRLRAAGPAQAQLVVRWSRWLSVSGPACVERQGDDVRVRFRSAGQAVVGSSLLPRGHC